MAHPRLLPALSESLRTSMRLLPHPVIVLTAAPAPTTTTTTTTTTPGHGHGITLSTLTCLSLQPHPLITFNIKRPSTTSSLIHKHPDASFYIHLLASTPHAAFVANAFAQLGATAPGLKRSPWDMLRGGAQVHAASGVPRLGREDGVLARWRCEKYKVVEVEDHEVWVGRVVEVEDLRDGEGGDELGLMYANRRFREVGEEVVAEFMEPGQEIKVGEEEEV